jgi:predicted methyltransferase
MKYAGILVAAMSAALFGCGDAGQTDAPGGSDASMDGNGDMGMSADAGAAGPASRLQEVLAAQPEEVRVRYEWRHPEETLELFRVAPGQTVMEVLPGGGWYTKILLPYLGSEGTLIGVDYEASMWPRFGFMDEAAIAEREQWPETWPAQVAEWDIENAAAVEAYTLATLPDDLSDAVDRVLFIRALHNLARFDEAGGYLGTAIDAAYRVLKPGGLAGVVQHRAPNDASDEWADGSAGYLKKAMVTRAFLEAGFVLAMESGINRNRNDQPTESDVVWRLPPTLDTGDDAEMAAQMEAIGESDRMTLVFRKPE